MIRTLTIAAIIFAGLTIPATAQRHDGDRAPGDTLDDPSIPDVGIDQRMGAQLPLDARLFDEEGHVVTLRDYLAAGKPIVFGLVYYECPMLCGETLNGMLEVFNETDVSIGSDYTVINVSFDPSETPALATEKKERFVKAYGRDNAAQANWHFLTAPEASSKALAEAIGYGFEYQLASDEYAHASAICVLTPEGKVSKYFFGVNFPAEDFRTALDDASDGAVGSIIKQAILRCYIYNDTTGQYTLSIMYLVRIAGMFTVALVLGFVGIYLLRESRERRVAIPAMPVES